MTWFQTSGCRSRGFCEACRTDAAWRETILARGMVKERDFHCPAGITADHLPLPKSASGGAGTDLKRLLARFRINPGQNCKCNALAARMDREGVEWCEANIEMIVTTMTEEAHRRRWMDVGAFARYGVIGLVSLAIRIARAKARPTSAE